MNKIILNSEILDELIISISKYMNKNNYYSYYFSPNIAIRLFSAKVSWMDNNSISFCFEKHHNLNLLTLLRNINSKLIHIYEKYKDSRGFILSDDKPCLFYEKEDNFYIKCNLPKTNNKYHIKCNDNKPFTKPNIGAVYKCIIMDIRNIWESQNSKHMGFKLELKEIEF